MVPEDIDPQSECRLPLPQREDLSGASFAVYDSLADCNGGSIWELRAEPDNPEQPQEPWPAPWSPPGSNVAGVGINSTFRG